MTSKEIRKAYLDFFFFFFNTNVPSARMVVRSGATVMVTILGIYQF